MKNRCHRDSLKKPFGWVKGPHFIKDSKIRCVIALICLLTIGCAALRMPPHDICILPGNDHNVQVPSGHGIIVDWSLMPNNPDKPRLCLEGCYATDVDVHTYRCICK